MYRTFLLTTALALASCGPGSGDSPIRIINAHLPLTGPETLKSGCNVATTADIISGTSVDVSGPGPEALVQLDLESTFDPQVDRVGDDILAGAERLDFYIDAVNFTYTRAEGGAFVPPQRRAMYAVIRPRGGLRLVQNLIAGQAEQAVLDFTAQNPAFTNLDLLVGVQYEGQTRGGIRQRSIPITFPVRAFAGSPGAFYRCPRGDPTTDPNTQIRASGVCGRRGGQHGTPFQCECPPGSTNPACNKFN